MITDTAPSAWFSNPEDQRVHDLSLILKTETKKKKALNASAFYSSLLVRWPPSSGIHSGFSLGLLFLLTYFKKAFFLVRHYNGQCQPKLNFFFYFPPTNTNCIQLLATRYIAWDLQVKHNRRVVKSMNSMFSYSSALDQRLHMCNGVHFC